MDHSGAGSQWVTRLRIATGVILFTYLTTHFSNHALGLISVQAMEAGQRWFLAVWRNPVSTVLLYGSLITHFGLALWSVYRRRVLRMPIWETTQLILGLAIPPLLMAHIVGTRIGFEFGDTEDTYTRVLYNLWVADPAVTIRQITVFTVAWIHGSIGLHFWLRFRQGYSAWLPLAYAVVLLLPTLGLLGFVQGGRAIAELAQDPAWVESLNYEGYDYYGSASDDSGIVDNAETVLLSIYWILLAGTLVARAVRNKLARRTAITVTYSTGRQLAIPPGTSVLEASRILEIPHASVCGGRSRCSTCRTHILAGLDGLSPPNKQESEVLARIGAPPNVRLACQTRPRGDISVNPLVLPADGMRTARQQGISHGHEREVAVLFADLRSFTQFSEHKLPFDVVFLLNRYFDAMGGAIESVDGHVDKFIGDGVMAIFGIHRPIDEACRRAIGAARSMSVNLKELNEELAREGVDPLRVGIGVHAGPAIVGEMGYGKATSITAIGDTVNTASRLEALTKNLGCQLIVSEVAVRHSGTDIPGGAIQSVAVRGREESLSVYAIADASNLPA